MNQKISVVVPIYNAESYLRRCIDSIINQSFRDIEIVLVNDGATDSSPLICDEYAQMDNRIVVVHKTNGGVCDARNVGMKTATSPWITFTESDDYLPENACESLYDMIRSEQADFALGAYYRVSSQGVSIKHLFDNDEIVFDENETRTVLMKKVLGLTGAQLKQPSRIDSMLTCTAKLFNADIIKTNNIEWISRKDIYSDCLDFIFKYTYFCKKAIYRDMPLYYYDRTNTQSQTAGYRPNTIGLWLYQFAELRRYIDTHNLSDTMMDAYYTRVCFSVIPIGGNAYRLHDFAAGYQEIKLMFQQPIYAEAFSHFDMRNLPIHWKLFFLTAKLRLKLSFYIASILMRKIMNKSRSL